MGSTGYFFAFLNRRQKSDSLKLLGYLPDSVIDSQCDSSPMTKNHCDYSSASWRSVTAAGKNPGKAATSPMEAAF